MSERHDATGAPGRGAISRRRVLGMGLGLAAGAAALAVAPAAIAGTGAYTLDDLAEVRTWRHLVGRAFLASDERGQRARLVLGTASALRHDSLLRGSGCLLVFRGARAPVLDGAVTLVGPGVGPVRVSIQPVDLPARHQSYQLIVDRREPSRRTGR